MAERKDVDTTLAMVAYASAALLLSLLFRFIFPTEAPPLKPFALAWHLVEGIRLFIYLYPSVLLSALVAPFGFGAGIAGERERFSPVFLAAMRKPLIGAVAAAALYALLTLLVQPLLQDARNDMSLRGYLFHAAKDQVAEHAEARRWREAANHLAVCEGIWPQSPETAALRDAVNLGLEELRNTISDKATVTAAVSDEVDWDGMILPGETYTALTAAEAIGRAREALRHDHPYDAHWLATVASRLAKKGSPEEAEAALLASTAWNAVSALEPDAGDLRAFGLYSRKREGYSALIGGDWVRSYYIYKELSSILPQDPDIVKFLALAERKTASIAFFADEVSRSLGEIATEAVLSIPSGTSTMLLNSDSLDIFDDVSYGSGLRLRIYDASGRLQGSMTAPYAKFLPFTLNSVDPNGKAGEDRQRTLVLLKALDREDKTLRWEPRWSGSLGTATEKTQVILDISYEDVLLALKARKGPDALSIGELRRSGNRLAAYGFFPQAFQGELIKRFYDPLNFLVLCIIVVALGWRLRSRKGAGFIGIPMLLVLPPVFDSVVQTSRMAAEIISLQAILVLPFYSALLLIFGVGALLFFLALVFLAGQRG